MGDDIMANRRLTDHELATLASPLLELVRSRIAELAAGDEPLFWALRRKLAKELFYDERGMPTHRKLLKATKRAEQTNKCATCSGELPAKNAVLDRFEAMNGYTKANTRLICPECDIRIQTERGYA